MNEDEIYGAALTILRLCENIEAERMATSTPDGEPAGGGLYRKMRKVTLKDARISARHIRTNAERILESIENQ